MKRAALAIVLGLAASAASAQPYAISWSTVDGGGAMGAAGGSFRLDGTAGQPDAGGPFAGSPFVLHAGFWAIAASGAVGPQADLAVAKTNGHASSIPGQVVTWTVTVTNAGPSPVTGATVTDVPPASVSGVAWTCAASAGSSCPPTGSGPINAAVGLLAGGSATFQLGGVVDPGATGLLANTASVTAPPGVADPATANNAATDTDSLTPRADLAVALSGAPDPVAPGAPLVYTLRATNLGPSRSPGMTLSSATDPALDFVWSLPGGPTCTFAAGTLTCVLGPLDPGGDATVTLNVRLNPVVPASISGSAAVAGLVNDPASANNAAQATTAVEAPPPFAELLHGTRLERALPAVVGVAGDQFRIRQEPYSSYEVVVDGASGDLGLGAGPGLERLDDAGAVLQAAQAAGGGPARSLRFSNATSAAIVGERVRVRTMNPAHLGSPQDTYRLRAWDTTLTVPRFNNSGSQVTVLLLQNPTTEPVTPTLYFWSPAGTLLATHTPAAPLPPRGLLVLGTAGIPALAGASGAVTIVHDAPYGALAGKAVALEPASGFSFDSPMLSRPR